MAFFTVKNTFINTTDDDYLECDLEGVKAARRRGSSLPPEAKICLEETSPCVRGTASDHSTCCSDNYEECESPRPSYDWHSETSSCDGCWDGGLPDPGPGWRGPRPGGTGPLPTSPALPRVWAQGVQRPAAAPAAVNGGQSILGPALAFTPTCAPHMLAGALTPNNEQGILAQALRPGSGRTSPRRCIGSSKARLDSKACMFVPSHPSGCLAAASKRTEVPRSTRTSLSAQAGMFKPEGPPAASEVSEVLRAVKQALAQEPSVRAVQLTKAPMGGMTTLTVHMLPSMTFCGEDLARVAQAALLKAAQRSEVVYVMGYGSQPFQDYGHSGGTRFSASLALVERSQHHLACWETYQQGRCSRLSSCRWRHPVASDLMQMVVEIKRASQKSPAECP